MFPLSRVPKNRVETACCDRAGKLFVFAVAEQPHEPQALFRARQPRPWRGASSLLYTSLFPSVLRIAYNHYTNTRAARWV